MKACVKAASIVYGNGNDAVLFVFGRRGGPCGVEPGGGGGARVGGTGAGHARWAQTGRRGEGECHVGPSCQVKRWKGMDISPI